MQLKGQVALVTGAARGIGLAIAKALAGQGATVVLTDIDAQEAQRQAQALGGRAFKLDVAEPQEVRAVFAELKEALGRLDILVNNAGLTRDALLVRMRQEDWDLVLNVNLKGAFLCMQEAVKIMTRQRYGRIISISSVVAFMGNAGQANYCASKAGLLGLTKSVAREYASRGITVNAVAPGFIQTAMTEALPEQTRQAMLKSIPLGRFGSAEDVAQAVLFLALPQSGYITGQCIHVNGGMYM